MPRFSGWISSTCCRSVDENKKHWAGLNKIRTWDSDEKRILFFLVVFVPYCRSMFWLCFDQPCELCMYGKKKYSSLLASLSKINVLNFQKEINIKLQSFSCILYLHLLSALAQIVSNAFSIYIYYIRPVAAWSNHTNHDTITYTITWFIKWHFKKK